MLPWPGKRKLRVVSACLNTSGTPDLALHEVEISYEEYTEGVHCNLVEEQLLAKDYEEPFLHFDEHEAPPFLVPAVQAYLDLSLNIAQSTRQLSPEDYPCHA